MKLLDYIEEIKCIARHGGGYIRTSQMEELGISRPMIKKYKESGLLEQVSRGLYSIANEISDEYVVLQKHCNKAIFSYGTALYLWGMSDRTPHIFDVTVPQGTHTSHLKRVNEDLRCHYIKSDLYKIGITQTISPQGGNVRLYDKERCICDIVRNKDKIEMQLFSQAIKEYFKGVGNARKLLKYSKIFKIEDKVRAYMEVLM